MKKVGLPHLPGVIRLGIAITFYSLILLFTITESKSQSLTGFQKQAIIDKAQSQLEAMAKEPGELFLFCKKNNVTGNFTFDLTLNGKGNVLTLFMVESSTEIKVQNMLKSKLSEVKFTDIKIPKNERIKFRYTLTF